MTSISQKCLGVFFFFFPRISFFFFLERKLAFINFLIGEVQSTLGISPGFIQFGI